jgi:hypothetical protein
MSLFDADVISTSVLSKVENCKLHYCKIDRVCDIDNMLSYPLF